MTFSNSSVIFSIGQELETVKCQCGMEYFLFCVLRDNEGTPDFQIYPQSSVYFCPFCGVKNDAVTIEDATQMPADAVAL